MDDLDSIYQEVAFTPDEERELGAHIVVDSPQRPPRRRSFRVFAELWLSVEEAARLFPLSLPLIHKQASQLFAVPSRRRTTVDPTYGGLARVPLVPSVCPVKHQVHFRLVVSLPRRYTVRRHTVVRLPRVARSPVRCRAIIVPRFVGLARPCLAMTGLLRVVCRRPPPRRRHRSPSVGPSRRFRRSPSPRFPIQRPRTPTSHSSRLSLAARLSSRASPSPHSARPFADRLGPRAASPPPSSRLPVAGVSSLPPRPLIGRLSSDTGEHSMAVVRRAPMVVEQVRTPAIRLPPNLPVLISVGFESRVLAVTNLPQLFVWIDVLGWLRSGLNRAGPLESPPRPALSGGGWSASLLAVNGHNT